MGGLAAGLQKALPLNIALYCAVHFFPPPEPTHPLHHITSPQSSPRYQLIPRLLFHVIFSQAAVERALRERLAGRDPKGPLLTFGEGTDGLLEVYLDEE